MARCQLDSFACEGGIAFPSEGLALDYADFALTRWSFRPCNIPNDRLRVTLAGVWMPGQQGLA
jgi:hypothetical protein